MWKIIKSNFRYNKISTFVVLFFVTIAVLLMIVGTSMMVSVDSLLSKKISYLAESDLEVLYSARGENADNVMEGQRQKLLSYEHIEDYERVNIYTTNRLLIKSPLHVEEGITNNHIFLPVDDIKKFPIKIAEEKLRAEGLPVYYSNYYNIKGLYELGDTVSLTNQKGDTIQFYIAGFVDTLNRLYQTYIYAPTKSLDAMKEFDKLDNQVVQTQSKSELMLMNVKAGNSSTLFNHIMNDKVPNNIDDNLQLNIYNNEMNVMNVKSFASIMGVLMMVFAIMISLVALIIIRFLIVSTIEDNIKNIGVAKSLGYQNRDIRLAYLFQYGIIFAVSIFLGSILALVLMQQFAVIISIVTNVILTLTVSPIMVIASILLVAGTMMLVLWLLTRRLQKIQPIMALRKGVTTHSFKKNHVALDKAKCSNNVAMSLKSIANNGRQSITVSLVVMIMAIVSSFTSVLYYNMNVNTSAVLPVVGLENCDAEFSFKNEYYDIAVNNEHLEYVNERLPIGSSLRITPDIVANGFGYKDYDKLKVDIVVEGRMPRVDNEIALHYNTMVEAGLKIGQIIKLNIYDKDYEFLICGVTQGVNVNRQAYLTYNAVKSAYTEQMLKYLHINTTYMLYFKEGVTYQDYMNFLSSREQPLEKVWIVDMQKNIDDTLSSFASGSTMLMSIMIIITALVLAMLIVMIVSLKIRREKNSIAISKAIGYRSKDVLSQITLNMVILTTIGSLIGVVLGALLTSPLLQVALRGYGVLKVLFTVNWWYILGIFCMVPMLTVIVTGLVSLGVSKISPTRLRV